MQHQPVSPTLLRKPTFPFIDVLPRYTHTTTFKTTSGESRSKARPFRSRHLTRARQTRRRPFSQQQPLAITVIIIIPGGGGLSGQAVTASYREGLGIGN